jgi:uncharacterized protein YfcZ (UPF0381/DUF406 family)
MKNWLPNKNIFRGVALVLALCAFVYVAMLFLVYQKRSEISSYGEETRSMLAQEEDSLRIKSIVDNHKDSIQKVRQFFIERGDEIEFIETIEAVARDSQVKSEISSISQSQNKDPEKEDIRVKVEVEGSWSRVATFLDKLEKMPFGILMQSVTLDSRQAGVWSGSIEFIVYREK